MSENETQRTKEQRAEDIAYTINHSLYCTLTDFISPPINAATDGYLRWLIPGCGHDHSKDGGHHDHHHDHDHVHGEGCTHHSHDVPQTRLEKVKAASRQSFSKERFIQYAKGEFIGDFGAVPITIGVQRAFPHFMNGLRVLTEPFMKPLFTVGVERDTKNWAKQNGIAPDSQAYQSHASALYDYEMSHFPQAVVWTGASLGLNTAYQVWADKSHMPLSNKLLLKSSSVLSGVLVTAGVVVAARALAPNRMHSFDEWTSENAILPTTKVVGKLFGVKEEDVDRMVQKEKQMKHEWKDKVQVHSSENEKLVAR